MKPRTDFTRGVALVLTTFAAGCGTASPGDAGLDATLDATLDAGSDASDAAFDARDAAPDGAMQPCSRLGTRPAEQQPPAFPGPSAPIDVYRDNLGVPHMFARTDQDAYFAAGYEQAVDRLFEMDYMRRLATGTQAEVFGPDVADQDQLIRMMNLRDWARLSADRMRSENPAQFGLVNAWVAGINRRVGEVTSGSVPLPPGFRASEFDYAPTPWTVDDALTVGKLLLFSNADQLEFDLLSSVVDEYVPGAAALPVFRSLTGAFILPPEERPVRNAGDGGAGHLPPAPRPPSIPHGVGNPPPGDLAARIARFEHVIKRFRSGGSNNWAVDGAHTVNGRPMLAGDPHQSLQIPSVFWAHHMNSTGAGAGGTLDVQGFGFAGAPGLHLGHNRHVAWTATTSYPDAMDLFDVPTSRAGATIGTQVYPIEHCVETINVRGDTPIAYPVDQVPGQGVLLPQDFAPVPLTMGSHRILLRWVGFSDADDSGTFIGLDSAATVADAEAAIDRGVTTNFNFVFADATGIAYRTHALVPDRGDPATMLPPYKILDATNPRALWTGAYLPIDKLPHSHGGVRGFLGSANNDPFGFTADYDLRDDPWYFGTWFDIGARASRIESELTRLTTRGAVARADMEALQMDAHNTLADHFLPPLFDAFSRVGTDPALAAYNDPVIADLVNQLTTWDRRDVQDSSAAVVFEAFEHFTARRVLKDDLGILFDPLANADPPHLLATAAMTIERVFPEADAYMQEGRDVILLASLAETRDWLVARFGGAAAANYRWDQYHRTQFTPPWSPAGPFTLPPVATAGAVGTVNVSQAQFFNGNDVNTFHESHGGAAYRMVVDFRADGTPSAEVNFPPGNVGDPGSPDFSNNLADWVSGTYHPMPFDRADVEAAAVEHTTIMP